MKLWIYNQKWYKQLCDSKRFNNLCSDVVRRGNACNLARKSLQFSSFTPSSSSSFGSFQCLITSKKKRWNKRRRVVCPHCCLCIQTIQKAWSASERLFCLSQLESHRLLRIYTLNNGRSEKVSQRPNCQISN
jgi:hypothetical protein